MENAPDRSQSGPIKTHAHESRRLDQLAPYERNARLHSAEQIAEIAASMRRWGFTNPLLIDDADPAMIIAGHGRLEAARSLGMDAVPVIVLAGLSEDEKRALVIADNQIALNATWDDDLLRTELAALANTDFDLGLLGFGDDLAAMMNPPPKPEQTGVGSMADEFLIPPFSVLNAREGWWQDRKRQWLALGIRSELGRGGDITPGGGGGGAWIGGSDRAKGGDPALKADRDKAARAASPGGGPIPLDRAKGRGKARTFGQDLLDNEHEGIALQRGVRRSTGAQPVEGQPGKADPGLLGYGAMKAQYTGKGGDLPMMKGQRPDGLGGVTMKSLSSHPRYYEQKTAAERKVGRELSPEEFERDHWVEPDSEIISGTSIFDPVLCELAYRWFSPVGGLVLDPFAGGSVRGIVAGRLGRRYVGVDLRAEQIEANRVQAAAILGDATSATWHVGDSLHAIPGAMLAGGVELADFVFSCPPYGDLEVYSDDPADISTLDAEAFGAAYTEIIARAVEALAPDRFACFVVGDYRDKRGFYRNFVSATIAAFEAAGARLYNEAILVTSVGSLPIRAAKQFRSTRKLGKTHQNILVFVKGDPRKATAACGHVDVSGAIAAYDESPPDEIAGLSI